MPIQYKIRRGSTSEANSLTLTEGEIYMDLGDKTLRVYDGVTQGGTALAKKLDLNSKVDKINISAGTVGSGSQIPVIAYNSQGQITSVSTSTLNIPANIATESYVQTQISNLVDSSPSTLNTLNELAAALNDDPNFATTIANQIGLKANTSSLAAVATSGSYSDLTNRPNQGLNTTDGPTFFGISIDYLSLHGGLGQFGQIAYSQGSGGVYWGNLKTVNDQSLIGTGNIPLFSGSYNDLTNKPFIPNLTSQLMNDAGFLTSNSVITFKQTNEVFTYVSSFSSTIEYNYNNGNVFYQVNLTGSFNANFTNIPISEPAITTLSLIIEQGSNAYVPADLYIDGVLIPSVKWLSQPTPVANTTGIITYTMIRRNSTWNVLGSYASYGA